MDEAQKALGKAKPGRRRGWPLGAVQGALLALAFYRGIHLPNAWSLNYYQVSWADGFFRRGLLGTLLLPLGCARFDPGFIHALQYGVLAAAAAALLGLGRRGAAAWLLCLMLASDWGVFLFNEIGYPEPWMLLLSLACLALLKKRRPGAAAALLALSLLVHEMALFTVVPAVAVFLLRLPRADRPPLAAVLAPAAAVLIALVAFSRPVDNATLARFSARAEACGHPLARPDFERDYQTGLKTAWGLHYKPEELAVLIFPFAAALAWWLLAGGPLEGAGRLEILATLGACLSPLLLGLLAWDIGRWYFLALQQVLLLVGTRPMGMAWPKGAPGRDRTHPTAGPPPRLSPATRLLRAAPLAAVVGLTPIPRFDGSSARRLGAVQARAFFGLGPEAAPSPRGARP